MPRASETGTKAKLAVMIQLAEVIRARNEPARIVAALLGIHPKNLSYLLNHHADRLSFDQLFEFAKRLGCSVEIRIDPGSRQHEPADAA